MTARIIAIATTLALNLGSVGIAPAALVWAASPSDDVTRACGSRRPAGTGGPRRRWPTCGQDRAAPPAAQAPEQRASRSPGHAGRTPISANSD